MELTASREIVTKLKAVKQEYELTIPRIKDMLEKNGDYISLSTLRRVFADNSEGDTFSYDRTLAPIARVLLFQDSAETDEEEAAAMDDRIDGLKAVVMLKNEEISRLREMLDHMERRVSFLLEQIEKKDRRMDEKDDIIRRLMDKCL